jgi:hypothetical protein
MRGRMPEHCCQENRQYFLVVSMMLRPDADQQVVDRSF